MGGGGAVAAGLAPCCGVPRRHAALLARATSRRLIATTAHPAAAPAPALLARAAVRVLGTWRGLATLPTNRAIKASVVRLIDEAGTDIGALSLDEALQIGEERGLDVVQVNAKADPPVCRLKNMEEFEKVAKQRERQVQKQQQKQKSDSKKIRLSPRTDDGSLQVKANQVANFLRRGMGALPPPLPRGRSSIR
eukprot:COSAG05_NODE_2158_length_3458_cov_3.579637_1_plen_193_part_00